MEEFKVNFQGEIEICVKTLEPSKLEELGSMRWLETHERLQKLQQQSVLEANDVREEAVKEAIVSHGKVPLLVREAICVSVWKEKVLPALLKIELHNTFVPYMVMYHEVTAVALLETLMFHQDSCEALEDTFIDLIDYCVFHIIRMETLKDSFSDDVQDIASRTEKEELINQEKELAFNIGMRSITIICYIAQALERLPLYATIRMYKTHDIPLLYKNLIYSTPWRREDAKGNTLMYKDGKWQKAAGEQIMTVMHAEAQVWLCLRQLLLYPKGFAQYEINEFRRDQLLQLQGRLHDVLLDQISPLNELKYWLSRLAMTGPPTGGSKPIVVEVIPEIRQSFMKRKKAEWKEIVHKQVSMFLSFKKEDMMEMAQKLQATFDLDTLERLCPEPHKCAGCGEPAGKRCSRCKTHWFCGRECQVKNWSKHKPTCDLIHSSTEEKK